jgi:hypothetical protein
MRHVRILLRFIHLAVAAARRREVLMHLIGLVMLVFLGLALVAGSSVTLYLVLPRSMLESATRHGRYVGLGTQSRLGDTPAGNTPATSRASLLGQRA